MKSEKIELLAPAKNLPCGLAAVNHGADAVYIGAPKFGARSAAGNSLEDIEQLARYAHRFGARVYAAVNTILYDSELDDAQQLIWQLYNAGTDALIVQDMGILQMDLPPIALHASTQTDNRTVEKLRVLEQVGFSQAVLARELSLAEIREISAQTSLNLESFVHGALCVSYSGQCYISEALGRRSANRGECAQYCRLPYDLLDGEGKILQQNKHLLSLKDLNRSAYLEQLLEAGVRSFKIEGRLKEVDYVKNVTAFYRQKLDEILEQDGGRYRKSSSGKTTFFFEPAPEKSFSRGFTDYFLEGRNADITSFDTPKSVGEELGELLFAGKNFYEIKTQQTLHNGDGLCFVAADGNFEGFRVNRVEGKRVFPFEMQQIPIGTKLYRNYDIEFDRQLKRNTSERKIAVELLFEDIENGFRLTATDEDRVCVSHEILHEKVVANNKTQALENLRKQLSKWGTTIFSVSELKVEQSEAFFIPSSLLSELRTGLVEKLEEARVERFRYCAPGNQARNHEAVFPQGELSYLGNVSNRLAEEFYRKHGVTKIAPAFELQAATGEPLMFTRHCLKYSLSACPKYSDKEIDITFPLSLRYKNRVLNLEFDCACCEMRVREKN